jgi:DNA-binding beta-propeller fold protein YncE
MMKMRLLLGIHAIVFAIILATGCGQEFKLPPEPEPGRIPTPGTHNFKIAWPIPSPTDLFLRGSYLYVIEDESRVATYLRHHGTPRRPSYVRDLEGLIRPVQICVAKKESTYVFVADAGDMMIKRYHWIRGGPPRHQFTDSTWVEFSGLAADEKLNVYVADAVRDTIFKYDVDGIPLRLISDFGSGYGFVSEPHGIFYNKGSLWVADTGKDLVQRLRPDTTNIAYEGDPIGVDVELKNPIDVVSDPIGGSVFVVEADSSTQVLRFQPDGSLQDTVYSHTKLPAVEPPLANVRYLAADETYVFLPDTDGNRIVVLELK